MQGSVRLGLCLLLVAGSAGCTHRGLMGLAPGESFAKAKQAFHPLVGRGTWTAGKDGLVVWTAKDGIPTKATLWTRGAKVDGVVLTFENAALRKAGRNPVTFRYDRAQAEHPAGATGPFVVEQTRIFLKGGILYEATDAGPSLEVGRYLASVVGLGSPTCAQARTIAGAAARGLFKGPLGRASLIGAEGNRAFDARRALLTAAAVTLACPRHSGILVEAGNVLLDLGRPNAAAASYRQALKLDAGWGSVTPADAHGGLALVAVRFAHLDAAVPEMDQAVGGSNPKRTAYWGLRLGDAMYRAQKWGEAAKLYRAHFKAEGVPGPDTGREVVAYAHLVRATLETVHGCKPASDDLAKGLSIKASDEDRAHLLAAKAFYLLACKPKEKRLAYRVLGQAVKLDPLKAADWADVTGYYDREANDAAVLKIMVQQGWLDRSGIRAAEAYQKMERAKVR